MRISPQAYRYDHDHNINNNSNNTNNNVNLAPVPFNAEKSDYVKSDQVSQDVWLIFWRERQRQRQRLCFVWRESEYGFAGLNVSLAVRSLQL